MNKAKPEDYYIKYSKFALRRGNERDAGEGTYQLLKLLFLIM